jgi:hypothetical protein
MVEQMSRVTGGETDRVKMERQRDIDMENQRVRQMYR